MTLPHPHLIFDLGGVIVNIDPSRLQQAFTALGLPNAREFFSLQGQHQLCEDFEVGRLTTTEFLQALHQQLPNASVAQLTAAWNANIITIERAALDTLVELKKRGHQLHVLSNNNALHYQLITAELLRDHPYTFAELFDQIFLSHEVGLRKPDPRFFQHALATLKIQPSQALFIDDLASNIATAKALGVATLQHPANQPIGYLLGDD